MIQKNYLAEWAPQSGVMLTWPHSQSDWAPYLKQVDAVFVEIVFHIAAQERVLISCKEEQIETILAKLKKRKSKLAHIRLYPVNSNDAWARDHGPITVMQDLQAQLLDFTFNGWGKKHDAHLDNTINQQLATQGAWHDNKLQTSNFVLEGGSIETDGLGTLLTTSACLLNPNRNPGMDKKQIEKTLQHHLGVNRFLWLNHGYLAGDDTDSHIDTLVRFCDPNTLCYVCCDDVNDEHYDALKAMEHELTNFRTRDNQAYKLIPLPLPKAIYNQDGQRLPATYANFLIINNAVLLPSYQDVADTIAQQKLAECFPQRKIISIDCLPLIQQYGSLHCVTMQLPEGILSIRQ